MLAVLEKAIPLPFKAVAKSRWRSMTRGKDISPGALAKLGAKRLAEFQPNDIQWTISLAYATRRADSLQAAKEILSNAESKFPKDAIIKYNLACYDCQLENLESAKHYLKQTFKIDSKWRLQALEDEDLKPLWNSLQADD